ncbi:MAG: hypothetical protein QXK81_06250 [Candidatus Bathyarchaeia archaeon]
MLKLAPWDRFATKEDIKMLLGFMEKRFEAIDKRFKDLRNYSDKRFEDLTRYVDKQVDLIEKLLIGFNIPILIGIIVTLVSVILH